MYDVNGIAAKPSKHDLRVSVGVQILRERAKKTPIAHFHIQIHQQFQRSTNPVNIQGAVSFPPYLSQ